MTSRAGTFERAWSRFESGEDSGAAVLDPAASGVAGELAAASALRELGDAIEAPDTALVWGGLAPRLAPEGRTARSIRGRSSERSPRWSIRGILAVAAVVVLIAGASLHASPGSRLYPLRTTLERLTVGIVPNDGGIRLRLAFARLDDLIRTLRRGPVGQAPTLAHAVVDERSAALHEHVDVSQLDDAIATGVPPALTGAPLLVARQVGEILGALLPPTRETTGPPEGSPPGGGTGSRDREGGSDRSGATDGSGAGSSGGKETGDQEGGTGGAGVSDSGDGGSQDGDTGDTGGTGGDGSREGGGSGGDGRDGQGGDSSDRSGSGGDGSSEEQGSGSGDQSGDSSGDLSDYGNSQTSGDSGDQGGDSGGSDG